MLRGGVFTKKTAINLTYLVARTLPSNASRKAFAGMQLPLAKNQCKNNIVFISFNYCYFAFTAFGSIDNVYSYIHSKFSLPAPTSK